MHPKLDLAFRRAEFKELTDGRGKLLIFTEHRDTLKHLLHHLEKWGYTVTEIHGGMNPHERKRAQEDFRTAKQICVATEAAGEGINLQFCRLMINYDLPWNPTRLEQRLGRIHRIGQERDCHAFNFVAAQSEEGQDIGSDRLEAVRRVGKPDTAYRKLTFHKSHLEEDQHLDAILLGPGHPLYSAVDERLNEKLAPLIGGIALYVDATAETPCRIHFFEISVRGQNTKGENQTLHGELVAVRQETPTSQPPFGHLLPVGRGEGRFSIVPADCLLDLPAHPTPPDVIGRLDPGPPADFVKSTYQSERRQACQEERRHFVQVCREYLEKSFNARLRAAQDRVMSLRAREAGSPEVALARQRAENDLADIGRSQKERMAGLDRLAIARHGPVRHIATAVVVPVSDAPKSAIADLLDDLDPN